MLLLWEVILSHVIPTYHADVQNNICITGIATIEKHCRQVQCVALMPMPMGRFSVSSYIAIFWPAFSKLMTRK